MDVRHRFQEVVRRPDERIDLAEAALLIAAQEYPELDVAAYLARFDEIGARLGQRVRDDSEPIASVLGQFLFAELGFKGNEDDYYDPRNSFLNDVLDRRTGIPITLSTVCIEVARRAGLSVTGIGLPGHFLIQVDGSRGQTLLDPFYGGTEDDGGRLPGAAEPTLRRAGEGSSEHVLPRRPEAHSGPDPA